MQREAASAAQGGHCSNPPDDFAAHQPGRPHDEHAHDQHQGHRKLEFGADDVAAHQVFKHAHDEAAQHGARGAVDAAQQRARKGIQQHAAHHVRIEEDHGRHHHPGHRADGAGQAPAQHQHAPHGDAHQARGGRVLRGRAHGQPQRREPEEGKQQGHDGQGHEDGAHLMGRHQGAAIPGVGRERAGKLLDGVAEDPAGQAVEDDQQADEDHHLGQVRRLVHGADDGELHRRAQHEGQRHRGQEGPPVRQPRLQQRPGDEGGEHGHLALREIDVVRGLVDHDQGQGHGGVDAASGQAGQQLVDEGVHGRYSPR